MHLARTVVGHAVPHTDSTIAAREEDADATRTELCEQFTHVRRIVDRDSLLVVSVPHSDRLWYIRLVKHVVKPIEERLVHVRWRAVVGFERRQAACAIENDRGRVR